jgi:kinesin family protein C1
MSYIPESPIRTPSKRDGLDSSFNLTTICSTTKKNAYAALNSSTYDLPSKNLNNTNFNLASSSISMNPELLQAKIEHLERERLDLSMQLHKRNEKERNMKYKIEQCESTIQSFEESKKKIQIELASTKRENQLLIHEKQSLSYELKRIEEELIQTTEEKNNLIRERQTLNQENEFIQFKIMQLTRESEEINQKYSLLLDEKEHLLVLNDQIKAKLNEFENHVDQLNEEKQQLQTQLQVAETEAASQVKRLEEEKSQIAQERDATKQDLEGYKAELEKKKAIEDARTECEVQCDLLHVEEEKEVIVVEPVAATPEVQQPSAQELMMYQQQQFIREQAFYEEKDDLLKQIEELKEKLFENEKKRRQLHNALQDFKGSIRVFIRCRPFLSSDNEEDLLGKSLLLFHEDKTNLTVIHPSSNNSAATTNTNNSAVANSHRIQNYSFCFDHIFNMQTNQDQVYREVTDLVQSVLDGYRVCIFSYGQTGSGKVS